MEVTKYYCETCWKELSYGEWTTVTITVRHKNIKRGPGEIESYSNKICDDCLKEVGLIETPITEPIKRETNNPPSVRHVLWNGEKFKNVIKNLIKPKGEKE